MSGEGERGVFFRISVSLIFCCVIPDPKERLTDERESQRAGEKRISPPLNGALTTRGREGGESEGRGFIL